MESSWRKLAPIAIQLLLAVFVASIYKVENPAFLHIFELAVLGSAVHYTLPSRLRLPFFVLLSVGATFVVFPVLDAVGLLATAAVLIGLANLPVPLRWRVASLLLVGLVLALGRAGVWPSLWSGTVWPILGSMFMFRLLLYVMASRTDPRTRRPWWAFSYFLMFPNLVFPLFPVIDYQTFRRTYYDREEADIYQQGLAWIVRGLVQLLLYRLVYQSFLIEAESVVTLGDLLQFMLATFLLYLRVSGQFHLIVGLLHLFGFRVPETHKLYYLAHSFTELWRRINIYWTDFMMKTVFYPSYFRVKRLGPEPALVISTIAVFLVTWLLHSYQWFWLRGGFPVTPQDILFWAVLGALVVRAGVQELRGAGRPASPASLWSIRRGAAAFATFTAFCVLWSIWSIESLNLWLWILGAATNVDVRGVILILLTGTIVVGLGGIDWPKTGAVRLPVFARVPHVLVTLVALVAIAALGRVEWMPERAAALLRSLGDPGLNAVDLAEQHRGYYEQLDVRAQLASAGQGLARSDRAWRELSQLGVLRERNDAVLRDLQPSRSLIWNGHPFSTNRWGMRDRDYEQAKPAGTFRIALLGPSHVMGNNVGDTETFENVLEDRLNEGLSRNGGTRVEILNFAVEGYSVLQQVAMLEHRVFDFNPDVVILTHYTDNRLLAERFLIQIVQRRVPLTDPALSGLLDSQGLSAAAHEGIPVPYDWARRAATRAGIATRMPFGEMKARIRRIADEAVIKSFERLSAISRQHGVPAAVLALNVVLDEPPTTIPFRNEIERLGLPVFDLFDVFPAADRPALKVAPWDDHPNAQGHRRIADRLYDELSRFLSASSQVAHKTEFKGVS